MRSDQGSSRLVRLLGAWTPQPADPHDADLAARLAQWISAFDAIGLKAAHEAVRTRAAEPVVALAARRRPSAQALRADVERVRGALVHAIAQPLSAQGDADLEAGFAPFHRRHQDLQRQMEQMIRPLREHVRLAVSRGSARLRQLATLDAALEHVITPREQALLPGVATRLSRRYEQLRRGHGAQDGDQAAWLAGFAETWRQALRAELDLRLEPVAGLVDALTDDSRHPT